MNNTLEAEILLPETLERSTESKVIILLVTVPILVLTILGNLLVILAWIVEKSVRSPQNAYYISLAFTDLFQGIFVLSFGMGYIIQRKWTYGLPLCKSFLIMNFSLTPISVFHLVAIASDRYRTVTEGIPYLHRRTIKSVCERCAFLWVLGLTISMPLIFDFDHIAVDPIGIIQCGTKKEPFWVIHMTIYCFIIPIYLILRIYSKIYAEIQKRFNNRKSVQLGSVSASSSHYSGQRHASFESNDTNEESISSMDVENKEVEKPCQNALTKNVNKPSISIRRERRAIKTLAIIIGAFVVCWTPWFVFISYSMILPEDKKPSPVISGILGFIGCINSCINPIIYAFRHPEFRKAFQKMLGRRFNQNT